MPKPSLQRLHGTRIIAHQNSLDTLKLKARILRFAPDDAFVLAKVDADSLSDPHAIVVEEQGFVGIWLRRKEALEFLRGNCEWQLPKEVPAFAQGMVAGLAMKLYFEKTRVLFMVPVAFEKILAERLS